MDVKFGKITSANNNLFVASTQAQKADDNFFAASQEKHEQGTPNPQVPGSRINDYDSNILENNAYQELPDDMLKLEYKISILENSLKKVESEIEALESLGYTIQISELKNRREKLKLEISELHKQYANLGLSAKISGQIASAINFTSSSKKTGFSKVKKFISKNILSKLSKKFGTKQEMQEALSSLSNINSSVDELINMQIPYGETVSRYEKLTAYLNKANLIHSQITKNVNQITKKSS